MFCTFLLNAALSTFQTVHYNTEVVARCDLTKGIDIASNPRDELEADAGRVINKGLIMWFNQDL